jgi:hypothetical protein
MIRWQRLGLLGISRFFSKENRHTLPMFSFRSCFFSFDFFSLSLCLSVSLCLRGETFSPISLKLLPKCRKLLLHPGDFLPKLRHFTFKDGEPILV